MPSCGVSLMENFSLGASLEQLQSSVGSRINTLSKCLRQIVPWMKKRESKFYGKDSTFAQPYQLLNSITNTVYLQSHFSLVKQLAQTDHPLKGCKSAVGQITFFILLNSDKQTIYRNCVADASTVLRRTPSSSEVAIGAAPFPVATEIATMRCKPIQSEESALYCYY